MAADLSFNRYYTKGVLAYAVTAHAAVHCYVACAVGCANVTQLAELHENIVLVTVMQHVS